MADARLAVLLRSPSPLPPTALTSRRLTKCGRSRFFLPPSAAYTLQRRKGSSGFMAHAIASETVETKWWEKNTAPNMIDIHSSKEFIEALSQAGDKLVVVDFYGTWCHSCRSLFPKICKIAEENQDILFLKVNFDENQQMCRRLNVIVLPCFHFYRGAEGNLESFPGSLLTLHRIRNAIATHNTARCSLGPPLGVGDLDLLDISSPHEESAQAKDK